MTSEVQCPSLSASGLEVARGQTKLLEGINLEAHGHEALVIVGPNGAGKSTLLRALAGLEPKLGGELRLGPRAVVELVSRHPRELARLRAYMTTAPTRGFDFGVLEYVLMGRYAWGRGLGWSSARERALASEALEQVELEGARSRSVQTLSAGELRRAQLARLLYSEAPWWIMDEPLANLDIRHQLLAARHIKRHCERGGGAIIALHQLDWAERIAHRVALLHRGRLLALGEAEQNLSPARLSDVYGVELMASPSPYGRLWFAHDME